MNIKRAVQVIKNGDSINVPKAYILFKKEELFKTSRRTVEWLIKKTEKF